MILCWRWWRSFEPLRANVVHKTFLSILNQMPVICVQYKLIYGEKKPTQASKKFVGP